MSKHIIIVSEYTERDCLDDLFIKTAASIVGGVGFLSGLSHTSDLEAGCLVTALPGTWCYGISVMTNWPNVSCL